MILEYGFGILDVVETDRCQVFKAEGNCVRRSFDCCFLQKLSRLLPAGEENPMIDNCTSVGFIGELAGCQGIKWATPAHVEKVLCIQPQPPE